MTTTEIKAPGANPLKKYFRQPKLYISLPSKGKFYPEGALEETESGEHAVYAMTAKDELAMKTPDALLNGQSTVDVIHSCVPTIKNAWVMPTLDIDAVLIAIRIATFGENMDINQKVPNTNPALEADYTLDLRELLDKLSSVEFDPTFTYQDMTVNIRPLTYKEFTKTALQSFEEQRIYSIVNNDELDEDQRVDMFNKTFNKLRQITIDMITNRIVTIQIGDEIVDSRQYINEFIEQSDKNFFQALQKHIESNKDKFAVKPLVVKANEEQLAAGAPEEWTVPIVFDNSNFFA